MKTPIRIAVATLFLGSLWFVLPTGPSPSVGFKPASVSSADRALPTTPRGVARVKAPPVAPTLDIASSDPHVSAMATMELARTAGPEQVDALLDQYWMMSDEGARLRILYIFARSRGRFDHAARDLLLHREGFELLNQAVQGDLDANTGAAFLALGALGDTRAVDVLTSIGADIEDPAAGDALFALARFPSEAGMVALEGLALDPTNDAVSLKALEAMVAAVHLSSDSNSLIEDARSFLATEGANISNEIQQQSEIAGVRHLARSLSQQLLSI